MYHSSVYFDLGRSKANRPKENANRLVLKGMQQFLGLEEVVLHVASQFYSGMHLICFSSFQMCPSTISSHEPTHTHAAPFVAIFD
jgi:hypothetical protein